MQYKTWADEQVKVVVDILGTMKNVRIGHREFMGQKNGAQGCKLLVGDDACVRVPGWVSGARASRRCDVWVDGVSGCGKTVPIMRSVSLANGMLLMHICK